jgi:hypothetical protein
MRYFGAIVFGTRKKDDYPLKTDVIKERTHRAMTIITTTESLGQEFLNVPSVAMFYKRNSFVVVPPR